MGASRLAETPPLPSPGGGEGSSSSAASFVRGNGNSRLTPRNDNEVDWFYLASSVDDLPKRRSCQLRNLLSQIHGQIMDRAMSELHKDFQLTSSRLGDADGLIGAAAIVWDQVGTSWE